MDDATRDWLLDHSQASYLEEIDRLQKLRDRIAFLSSQLTLLGGIMIYLATTHSYFWLGWPSLAFYVPAIASLILFGFSLAKVLYCLGRGFDYEDIPNPKAILDFIEATAQVASQSSAETVDILGQTKTFLVERYTAAAAHNQWVNQRRTKLIVDATQYSVIAFVVLIFACPAFLYDIAKKGTEPTTVIVAKPITIQR